MSLDKAVTFVVTSSKTLSMVYNGTDESHVLKGIFVNEDMRTLMGQKAPCKWFFSLTGDTEDRKLTDLFLGVLLLLAILFTIAGCGFFSVNG